MKKAVMAMVAGVMLLTLSSCGKTGNTEDAQINVESSIRENSDGTGAGQETANSGSEAGRNPEPKESFQEDEQSITDERKTDIYEGEYRYSSDYGTGKLIIKKASEGYDISDYESESSYRFLADSSNIERIENNRIYIKYPEQVFSDGTAVFGYYILEYNGDEIDVYYGKSGYEEVSFLYHAVKNKGESNAQADENPDSEMTADELLDSFINGQVNAISSTDSTSTFYITDLNMDSEEWDSYSVGEKVDLDNDGENELIICGPYGGRYLDARDNKVYEFAAGDGNALTLSYVVYNGATWIMYSNRMNAGYEAYHMVKFGGADNIVAEMDFSQEPIDENNIESEMKYIFNGTEISYDEYAALGSKIFATEVNSN